MRYEVKLLKSDDGYAVWCPALPGCWSQGATRRRWRTKDAIAEYPAGADSTDPLTHAESRTVDIG